jgi:hypothetical protein
VDGQSGPFDEFEKVIQSTHCARAVDDDVSPQIARSPMDKTRREVTDRQDATRVSLVISDLGKSSAKLVRLVICARGVGLRSAHKSCPRS